MAAMTGTQDAVVDATARANYTAFTRAFTAKHQAFLTKAKRCNNFYLGEQWEPGLKRALESRGFPALTLNQIYSIYNSIYDHYASQQVDFLVKARRRGASSATAEMLTRLIDIILDENNYHTSVEPQLFDDGNIETRGFLDVRMDYSENVLGEIRITTQDPRMVVIDPDAREYDPETWTELFIERWMSLNDIEDYYGKAARQKLEAHFQAGVLVSGSNINYHNTSDATFGGTPYNMFGTGTGSTGNKVDLARLKSVRVIERQYRRARKVKQLVSLVTGDTRTVPPHVTQEQLAILTQKFNLAVREVTQPEVRWTITADSLVVHDDWADMEHFTLIPYFPIFRRGTSTSPVAQLLDPQEYLNKLESQLLRSVNSSANSGWQYEAGSIVNMTDEEFKAQANQDGLVVVRRKNSAPVEKINSNSPPTGLDNAGREIFQMIRSISGVEALLGTAPSSELAGVTLKRSQNAAEGSLQRVFDNLALTRRLLGERIIDLIQSNYTEPRVFMAADLNLGEVTDPNQLKQVLQINVRAAGKIINDVTLGEYALNVGSAPRRDTANEMQFAQLIALRSAGIQIPDYRILERANIHAKSQIVEESKQAQGFAPPTPEQAAVQQLKLREMVAQVSNAEATVQKLISEAEVNQAKANSLGANVALDAQEQQLQRQKDLAKIVSDLQKTKATLENKISLAQMHIAANQDKISVNNNQRRASESAQHQHEADLVALNATLKPQ